MSDDIDIVERAYGHVDHVRDCMSYKSFGEWPCDCIIGDLCDEIERLRAGLIDVARGRDCETFTGPPYCRDVNSGRSRGATFGADRWCDTCIAHDALASTTKPPIGKHA